MTAANLCLEAVYKLRLIQLEIQMDIKYLWMAFDNLSVIVYSF